MELAAKGMRDVSDWAREGGGAEGEGEGDRDGEGELG